MTAAVSSGAWVALAVVLFVAVWCAGAARWPHLTDQWIARLTNTEHLHDEAGRLTKQDQR